MYANCSYIHTPVSYETRHFEREDKLQLCLRQKRQNKLLVEEPVRETANCVGEGVRRPTMQSVTPPKMSMYRSINATRNTREGVKFYAKAGSLL